MTNRRSARFSMAWTNSSTSTVGLLSAVFNVKSFTKSWLTSSFWIAYVYLAFLLILFLVRVTIRGVVDFVGWSNAFGLRNAIARERGIAAYRAWVPFERIRPDNIPQEKWEEAFAWPANNRPPYPPLAHRVTCTVKSRVPASRRRVRPGWSGSRHDPGANARRPGRGLRPTTTTSTRSPAGSASSCPEDRKDIFLGLRRVGHFNPNDVQNLIEGVSREEEIELKQIMDTGRDPATGLFLGYRDVEKAKEEWRRRWWARTEHEQEQARRRR